jgi:hypothetical protein
MLDANRATALPQTVSGVPEIFGKLLICLDTYALPYPIFA